MKVTVVLVGMMALLGAQPPARAYMASGHLEATKRGLARAGFGWGAINLARIANYQIDYMTNKYYELLSGIPGTANTFFPTDVKVGRLCAYFHFDDLPTAEAVARELAWLERAARWAALRAVQRNDPEMLLNALGIILHAVQDLYSHSNASDQPWVRWTGSAIVDVAELPDEIWRSPKLGIRSGNALSYTIHPGEPRDWPAHGDAAKVCERGASAGACGQNRDSAWRPGFAASLEMAVRATRRWAEKFRAWVANETFWQKVRTYSADFVNSCLAREVETAAAAGAYGYPRDKSIAKFLHWALFGAGCSWDWQDRRWGDLLIGMQAHCPPDFCVSTAAPVKTQVALRPGPPRDAYLGDYRLVIGTGSARHLVLRAGSGPREITGTLYGSLNLPLGQVSGTVNGPEADLTLLGGVWRGKGHLMTRTRGGIAGYLHNSIGIPTGFYAVKLHQAKAISTPSPPGNVALPDRRRRF